jgi:glyoxylase-like metal-dependent hydrolase (beta-lactamase superfamily II)
MSVFASVSFTRTKGGMRGLMMLAVASLSTFTAFEAYSLEAGPLQASAKALGAAKLQSIEFSGTGHWYQFGQAPSPNTAWPQFDVSSFTATIDFDKAAERVQITRKQTVEPGRLRPAPVEQKADQYVSGTLAWNLGGNPVTAQPQAAAVEERVSEIWTTPQGFLKAAAANSATSRPVKNGAEVSFAIGKNHYVGTINKKNQVERVQTWIDTPVLGDTAIEYTYSDYKDYNGVSFPSHILRVQGGYPVLALEISSVTANAAANISVPPEVSSAGVPKVTVTSEQLAPGVFYLRGGTHHSVAIEQNDHVVLVEAPLNEARSEALIAKISEIIPNKPIRFVVNTHQHFDHSGGLRTFVDAGATIVTPQLDKPYYEKIWANPHTINPDRLAKSKKPAKFETFTDKYVLTDGHRSIEIHQIAGSGHDDAFALVYLPAEKVLIEADAFTPTAGGAPLQAPGNPYTINLYENIKRLKLDVDQIAALHGPRVTKLADLQAAIGQKSTAGN